MKKHLRGLTGVLLSAALALGILLSGAQPAAAGYFEGNKKIGDVQLYVEDGAPVMSVVAGTDMVQVPIDGVTPDPMQDSNGLMVALLISKVDLIRCASDLLAWGYYDTAGEYHPFDTSSYAALVADAAKVSYGEGMSDEESASIVTQELTYMVRELLLDVAAEGQTGLSMKWLDKYMQGWTNHTFLYPISFGAGYGAFYEEGAQNSCQMMFVNYRGVVTPDTPDEEVDAMLDIAGIAPDRKDDAPYLALTEPTEYVLIVYPPATGATANLAIDHFMVSGGESVADEGVAGSEKYVKPRRLSTRFVLDAEGMTYVPGEKGMSFPSASVVAEDGALVEAVSVTWSSAGSGEPCQAPTSAGVYEASAVLGQEASDRYLAPEPVTFTVEPAQPVLNNTPVLAKAVREGDGLEALDLTAWRIAPDVIYPEQPEVKVVGSFAAEPDNAFRFDAEHCQIMVTFTPEDSVNYRQISFALEVTVEAAEPSLPAPVVTYFGAVKGADGGYTARYSGWPVWLELLTVRDENGRRLDRREFRIMVQTQEGGDWQPLSSVRLTDAGTYWIKTAPVKENGYGETAPVKLTVAPSTICSIYLSGLPASGSGKTGSLSESELADLQVRTDGACLGGMTVTGGAWADGVETPTLVLTMEAAENYALSARWTERNLTVSGTAIRSKTASCAPETGTVTVTLEYPAPDTGRDPSNWLQQIWNGLQHRFGW